ncbi:MAG: cyclic nucleotide-binding domain-containing protein [Betaproteobacteria bacterium]|nr:cyclic nucleotide-binding domain-containing protein [Betaproteobacteria bacterium]
MNSPAALPGSLDALKSANGGFYNAAVAKTFFESYGQRNQIAAGTVLFEENEKSNKQGLFAKPLNKALTTPINQDLFAKRNIHRMYFLADGAVELNAGGKLLETVWPGDVFGEMAVISEIPDLEIASARSATAIAKSDCVAYSLDGPETQAGLAKTPEFALMLMSVMFERLRFLAARLAARTAADDHRSLKSEPVFESAMLASLQEKLERATTARFAEGAKIMKEGAPGTAMYIVLEGRVAIAIGRRIVEKLSIGGVFGEMALVDQSPRTATAVARTDCTLLAINRESLMSLVKSDPAIGMAMMRAVAQRVRYMNSLFN